MALSSKWFEEAELPKEEFDKLVTQWTNDNSSIPACVHWCKDGDTYVALDNMDGECWVEEFTSRHSCRLYCAGVSYDQATEHLFSPSTKEELKALCDSPDIYLGDINTSQITDMSNLFRNSLRNNFDGIEYWDTSNVKDMSGMFADSYFDDDLHLWDTSNVENMGWMFHDSPFCGDVSSWDVSNVVNMSSMFSSCPFNRKLEDWDVSHVRDMSAMFSENHKFNQDIGKWDVSHVKNMMLMFSDAHSFAKDISNWNTESVMDTSYMFSNAFSFDSNISRWNMSNCKDASHMFEFTKCLNSNVSSLIFPASCDTEGLFIGSNVKGIGKNKMPTGKKGILASVIANEFVDQLEKEGFSKNQQLQVLKSLEKRIKAKSAER